MEKTEIGILLSISILVIVFLPQNVEAVPPSPDLYEKHRKYVDSIISLQEKPSIKEQIRKGIPFNSVFCNNDFVLLLKWTSNQSVCVSTQTAERLVERNWGVYAKDVKVLNFGDDPYKFFVGGQDYISFEYDASVYDETKLFKKIREKLSEHLKELGRSGDHIWAYMRIEKNSEENYTLAIVGGIREDRIRGALEKVEGISNIRDYEQEFL